MTVGDSQATTLPQPWNPYLHPPKAKLFKRRVSDRSIRRRKREPLSPPASEKKEDVEAANAAAAGVGNKAAAPSSSSSLVLIDNSRNVYIPVYLKCGVQVMCRTDVLFLCPLILRDLNTDLRQALEILPKSLHALVRRTRIWVNHTYAYGPQHEPIVMNHSTAHHHEGWLLWARDRPDKTLGIEIYNCFDYRRMRLHWNGCGLILHELCHLIHQVVLPDGLDNAKVQTLFEKAQASGLYNRTLRRDWAGMPVSFDMHYCMVDHKEFFAEQSVTFLAKGYTQLDNMNMNNSMESCSPPIIEPRVLTRLQSMTSNFDSSASAGGTQPTLLRNSLSNPGCFFDPLTNNLVHCNKFFPFTSGQQKRFDPDLHDEMDRIWSYITEWNDPLESRCNCGPTIECWFPWTRQQQPMEVSDTVML